MSNKHKPDAPTLADYDEAINKLIAKAIDRTISALEKKAKEDQAAKFDPFRATIERLKALPGVSARVERYKDQLAELIECGPHGRSKDICLRPSGTFVGEDDAADAQIQDLHYKISKNIKEIQEVEWALEPAKADKQYLALDARFFKRIPDAEVAAKWGCDERTVYRHCNRLVSIVAARLYGVDSHSAVTKLGRPDQERMVSK